MKDQITTQELEAPKEIDADKDSASNALSSEAMQLMGKPQSGDQPNWRQQIEEMLVSCSFENRAEPMSKEEIDKSAGKIADVISKKGDFGNAFQREALNSALEAAQKSGQLDEFLQTLNAQIKKTNPDLTISWNTTIDRDSNGGKNTATNVNLVDARTGKTEDKASVKTTEAAPCRDKVVMPDPNPGPFPRPRWGRPHDDIYFNVPPEKPVVLTKDPAELLRRLQPGFDK